MSFTIPDQILIATNNKGKFVEIEALLKEINIKAVSIFDRGITEPEETGGTFEENSRLKARYYASQVGIAALADDSGLCIADLDNQPGIHSARFAKKDNGQNDFAWAFEKIFTQLKEKGLTPDDALKAHFICNLSIFDPISTFEISFEGRVDGKLCLPRGEKGFGYDPIFIKDGMDVSFGEIQAREKDKISHRGDAFTKMVNWLKK